MINLYTFWGPRVDPHDFVFLQGITNQNKHRVFKKDSSHPTAACKRVSTKASKEVRRAKKKLAENIKKDSKSFFAYVRVRSTSIRKVGPY